MDAEMRIFKILKRVQATSELTTPQDFDKF